MFNNVSDIGGASSPLYSNPSVSNVPAFPGSSKYAKPIPITIAIEVVTRK
jgi:hypothetical protein